METHKLYTVLRIAIVVSFFFLFLGSRFELWFRGFGVGVHITCWFFAWLFELMYRRDQPYAKLRLILMPIAMAYIIWQEYIPTEL